jgi:Ca-activated chloride channel family protein
MASDHYSTLGLPYNATPDEVRGAYFLLARTLHPDVNPDPAARDHFFAVQKAYEVLSNPEKRARYDSSLPADLRAGPEISVSARYSRIALPCLNEPQLTYVLLDLVCTADTLTLKGGASPAHVCLVLDRSTSMAGARMDMVKSAALNLLQQLRSQDILSVIAFSDRAEVVIPPTRASALSKSDHRVSLLQTGGGTEILQGLLLGIEQLRQTDVSYLRQLALLTDGHTYGDDEGCLQLAREAAGEGININVLGIGHEWNDALMDQITSLSGGSAQFVASPRDIDNFLMQKLAEMETIYARGLRFEFESSAGIELRYAFRLQPYTANLPTSSPILLGDIQNRRSISLLLEFLVPPLTVELERLTLARGQIRMEIFGRKAPNGRLLIDLHRPAKINLEPETPPPMIVEAMAKLTLYRLQEKVRQEVEQGQVDKATRHLHYLATHLLSQGDRELAHTVLIEAEHIQQSRRFSGEGEKRIKYGTRALLLPSGPEIKP